MVESSNPDICRPRFRLGRLVATPRAIDALRRAGHDPADLLRRHRSADWGDINEEDGRLNDAAIAHEGDIRQQARVLSVYVTNVGDTIWVITEYDRTVTTFMCPDEY